jgi:hypothetical protein
MDKIDQLRSYFDDELGCRFPIIALRHLESATKALYDGLATVT